MDLTSLKGKKILLTQNALHFISGSEVVLLELADFFQKHEAKVIVFTWFVNEPMATEFEKKGIKVTTDDFDPDLMSPDFIWVQHQVLPIGILQQMFNKKIRPFCIFNHMSALDDLYLEQPYIYNLEKELSSLSLFVSEESLHFNKEKYRGIFNHTSIFPNPCPEVFLKKNTPSKYIKKVLIVSNHPPCELAQAANILRDQTIDVDYIGKNQTTYQLINPSVLEKYDAIITIGKTVQYCLTLNKPVYIYDHFGGCGYLNEKNYNLAKENNFSGRGFKKKTPEQISKELVIQFYNAQKFIDNNYNGFVETFSLEKNIENILAKLPKQPHETNFSKSYFTYLKAAETITKQKIVAENQAVIYSRLNKVVASQQDKISELEQDISNLNQIISNMENSRITKIAKKIHGVPRSIKGKINIAKKQPKSKLFNQDYSVSYVKSPNHQKKYNIIGLILERNESLILNDTLTELEKIVDGFIILDDYSTDNSIEIAKNHPKCLAIIRHSRLKSGNRSMEESIHREMLLQVAKKYSPKWLFYQDADERVEEPEKLRNYILEHINDPKISGIKLSLFDAYMTTGDCLPYTDGNLLNYRKMFGPERRDILFAWKNTPDANFISAPVMREPANIDNSKIVTKFYVQHYGKSLSIDQWEETCDYYMKHFPQYSAKWESRKGKAIHKDLSDFNRPLGTWKEIKKNKGVKIN